MDVIKILLNYGASVNTRHEYGHTPLSLAAIEGKLEIVQLLLEKGADVHVSGGQYNRTPLMRAAECGQLEVVKLLINNGASVNTRDKDGLTALSLAVRRKKYKTVELLSEKGAIK